MGRYPDTESPQDQRRAPNQSSGGTGPGVGLPGLHDLGGFPLPLDSPGIVADVVAGRWVVIIAQKLGVVARRYCGKLVFNRQGRWALGISWPAMIESKTNSEG